MSYLLRRLEFFAITLWAALTVNFLLPRLMPGSPAEAMLVSVMSLQSASSDPGLHLYDSTGNLQAFQVLDNDGLNYLIQLTGIVPKLSSGRMPR